MPFKFSENLRNARMKAGLSQKEVAEKVGVAQPTYSLYESGRRNPNVEMIKKLAAVLNTTGDELLGLEDETADYYIDEKARSLAEFLANNPAYQVLFDAARDVRPEDIDFVRQMIERMTDRND